jgi:hypothetical protein
MQTALATVAGLDLKAYEDIRPTAYALYDFEVKVAKGSAAFPKKNFCDRRTEGSSCGGATLEDDLPLKLNAVMVAAESRSHE